MYTMDDDELEPDLISFILQSQSDKKSRTVISKCESLTSLAAKTVGKYLPSSALESHDVLKTEHLMKKILFWAFPQNMTKVKVMITMFNPSKWTLGESMVERVEDIHQVGFSLSGLVKKGNVTDVIDARVSLTFEKQSIKSTSCSSCPGRPWCSHIVAITLYRLRNPEQVPIHLPIMVVLSSLNRQELQKFIQYAIHEDPGSLIPRLFKFINEGRNPESEINQTEGLPDASFVMDQDDKNINDMSLEVLHENLRHNIRSLDFSDRSYPNVFDFVEKGKSKLYRQYIGSIKALIQHGEVDLAGKTLLRLASVLVEEIDNRHYHPPALHSSKQWLRVDIERLFCCFLVSFEGPIKWEIVNVARFLNRHCGSSDKELYLKLGDWVSMRLNKAVPLNPLKGNVTEEIFPDLPFYESLCACLIKNAPSSFVSLLNQDCRRTQVYKEALPVMMLRFDSILLLGLHGVDTLWAVGVAVLKRLLDLSSELSIVCPDKKVIGVSLDRRIMLRCFDTAACSSPKRPRYSDTNICDEEDIGEPEFSDKEWQKLSKANVSYCLLYVCYTLYRVCDMSHAGDAEISVLMNATLLALEMGRYRCDAPEFTITRAEFSFLIMMEDTVTENFINFKTSSIESLRLQQKYACERYLNALREKSVGFYCNHLALMMIKTLIQVSADQDTGLRLSVDILCYTTEPLIAFRREKSYERSTLEYVKDKLKFFVQILLEEGAPEDPLLLVLQHLQNSLDVKFCSMVVQVLPDQYLKDMSERIKISTFQVIIHIINIGVDIESFYWNEVDKLGDVIESLLSGLDVCHFVTIMLNAWKRITEFCTTRRVSDFADMIATCIRKEGQGLSLEVTEVLFQFLEEGYKHNEEVAVMIGAVANPAWRKSAIQKVIKNSTHFSPISLLALAKSEYYNADITKQNTFPKDIFQLIECAFEQMKKANVCDIELNHVDWCFSELAEHGIAGHQFCKVVKYLQNCLCSREFLLAFFKTIESCESLLTKAKSLFGDHLVKSYRELFADRMLRSKSSSYNWILKEMAEARTLCIKYVDKGGKSFYDIVTEPLRQQHKGKRNFISLMSSKYSDLLRKNNK